MPGDFTPAAIGKVKMSIPDGQQCRTGLAEKDSKFLAVHDEPGHVWKVRYM